MNAELKKVFHEAWYEACLMSVREKSNPSDLLLKFHTLLRDKISRISLTREEIARCNLFLSGVMSCIEARTITALIADMYLRDLVHTGILIQTWLSETKDIPSHFRFVLRRKSIESDLTKILDKVLSNETPEVKDRFGFTLISFQNENLEGLYNYAEFFVGICTGIFYDDQHDFLSWILENPKLTKNEKRQVVRVLNSNLNLRDRGTLHGHPENFDKEKHPEVLLPPQSLKFFFSYGFKDHIKSPKENSYQALQGVFNLSVSLWDVLEELLSGDVLDLGCETRAMFSSAFHSSLQNVFPEMSDATLDNISSLAPSIRIAFPIEVHFKTQNMWDNPVASHASHKGRVEPLRKLFTLSKEEIKRIKAEASEYGNKFNFYDDELCDSWGLHYPMNFAPEERIFYED
ncbi:MAG: hypothetical protein IKF38_05780 [Clostridia bacterium]|nr:hypothetical protein [Clostridia bacterium]